MKRLTALGVVAAFSLAPAAAADTSKIYMGITPVELAEFLGRAGWVPYRPVTPQDRSLQLSRPGGGLLSLVLLDCDAEHRCRAGFLQHASYMTVAPQHAWHWNHENHGAVAFGQSYYSLKRPLHFRGVTETYLREVILEIWPKADGAFATDGQKAHDDYWRRRNQQPKR
jgi:hypothetical protein